MEYNGRLTLCQDEFKNCEIVKENKQLENELQAYKDKEEELEIIKKSHENMRIININEVFKNTKLEQQLQAYKQKEDKLREYVKTVYPEWYNWKIDILQILDGSDDENKNN